MNRTMVKMRCVADGIEFRTFSKAAGKSSGFYVFRNTFEDLEALGYAIRCDSNSYAVFRRDDFDETVSIRFDWISRSGDRLLGREETVVLDYGELMAFVQASAQADGPKEWRSLSMSPQRRLPRLVFCCAKRLRECIENKTVRHKLVKFLRDNFKWPRTERIEFYSDFVPYSFFFREYCNGKPAMCGGVILHEQDDMSKAYYSIHT